MKSFFKAVKTAGLWTASFFLWSIYAYLTLDRSEAAIVYGLGNPIPGGLSFVVLSAMIAFLLRKTVFSKRLKGWGLFSKLVVLLLLIFGLILHWPQITGEF